MKCFLGPPSMIAIPKIQISMGPCGSPRNRLARSGGKSNSSINFCTLLTHHESKLGLFLMVSAPWVGGVWCVFGWLLPSLKLTANAPENRPSKKRKCHLNQPSIFRCGKVSFREGNQKKRGWTKKEIFPQVQPPFLKNDWFPNHHYFRSLSSSKRNHQLKHTSREFPVLHSYTGIQVSWLDIIW